MTKSKPVPPTSPQARFRVRIAFEGMLVGDEFTMQADDPYVLGLLGAHLIEQVSTPGPDDASRVDQALQERHVTPAGDDASRVDAGVEARRVPSSPTSDDTSSLPADATP